MEYVYASMLLHKAGKPVDEAHIEKVLDAAGVKVDKARAKATAAALKGVNIDDAIKNASVAAAPAAAPAAPAPAEAPAAEKKEEKPKEEEKKTEEEAAAGLSALFG